jgi:hypothetical protein
MPAKKKKSVLYLGGARRRLKSDPSKVKPKAAPKPSSLPPVHPWRICPYGEHWVKAHPLHVPPSKTHPSGSLTTRHEHCARNPSGKDQLYPDEIREIVAQHFPGLKRRPCPLPLGFGADGSKYDELIAGWVQYWNDVLKPAEPLDSNFVKALIATESGFDPTVLADKKNKNSARGLMQVTNDTREILGDDSGEIKDHYITGNRGDLNDPSVNICAGVRWLFQKRDLLSHRLGHPASWLETVGKYKGTTKVTRARATSLVGRFEKKYEELQKCRKK